MRIGFVVSVALCLSACIHGPLAGWRATYTATTELEFLVGAINADPMEREALWDQSVQRSEDGDEQQALRMALLASLPGHSGHAPGRAERRLREIRDSSNTPGIAAIAALRLSDLRVRRECEDTISELEERLSQIANIERDLERR